MNKVPRKANQFRRLDVGNSLWPNFSNLTPPRGMREMLYEAAGDIGTQTNGKIDFFVDSVGIGASGAVQKIRYNCYLRIPRENYLHLFFRVTSPVGSPFPATLETPEGERHADLKDEDELRDAIAKVLQRPRTQEVVLYLLSSAP